MTNYLELLRKAKEDEIVRIYVAYEMECCLEEKLEEEDFNFLCNEAYKYWLDSGYGNINEIVRATINAYNFNDTGHPITEDEIEEKLLCM